MRVSGYAEKFGKQLDNISSLVYTLLDNPILTNENVEMTKEEKKLAELLKRDIIQSYQRDIMGLTKEDDLDAYLESRLDKY